MIYKLQREPVHAGPSDAARRVAKARRKVALKGLLSDGQKATLCILATEAAHAADVSGYKEVIAWRKQEQWERFGLRSLRDATQEQFMEIKAHFEARAGHPDRALDTALRGNDNARRQARWNLDNAVRESGLPMAYVIAICKRQYRCGLEDANAKQLKNLMFTIRNRASTKRKQESEIDQPF